MSVTRYTGKPTEAAKKNSDVADSGWRWHIEEIDPRPAFNYLLLYIVKRWNNKSYGRTCFNIVITRDIYLSGWMNQYFNIFISVNWV